MTPLGWKTESGAPAPRGSEDASTVTEQQCRC